MDLSHKRPVIGIVPDLVQSEEVHSKEFPLYALRKVYTDAILKVNAIPLVIPYQYDNITEALSCIDGLVLAGGGDVDPKFYSENKEKKTNISNDERDKFEMFILSEAIKLNLPILGICRGMQLLNIVYGGSLIQHIPDYINEYKMDSNINHVQILPKNVVTHKIRIIKNTKLEKIASNNLNPMVNSTHHQAIRQLGKGLVVSAMADDDIIEAVESTEQSFVIGVQWHPEYLNDNDVDFNLFKSLIVAAIDYRESL